MRITRLETGAERAIGDKGSLLLFNSGHVQISDSSKSRGRDFDGLPYAYAKRWLEIIRALLHTTVRRNRSRPAASDTVSEYELVAL
jgi:hypothetical protein